MKKLLTFTFTLLGFILTMNAQWNGTGPLWTNSNVGIGITSPEAKLHVSGTIISGVKDYSYNAAVFQLTNQSNVDGISGVSPTGAFRWYTNPNNSWRDGFLYQLRSYESVNGESSGLITIKGNGNTGIGANNPLSKLHINTTNSTALRIERPGSNVYGFEIGGATLGLYDYTNLQYRWRTDGNNLLLAESGGSVGIGGSNIDPKYKLDVFGSARIQSNLNVKGLSSGDMLDIVNEQSNISADADLIWGTYGWTQTQVNNPGLLSLSGPNGAIRFKVRNNGQVGIGIDPGNSSSLLTVNGKIDAVEIEVKQIAANNINVKQNIWADDVFSPSYKLMNLRDLEAYINKHNHLPNVPSEAEVKENGVNVAEMNVVLLRKVEELTKYVLELKKEIDNLKNN